MCSTNEMLMLAYSISFLLDFGYSLVLWNSFIMKSFSFLHIMFKTAI